MSFRYRSASLAAVGVLIATVSRAQTPSSAPPAASTSQADDSATRPATTTFFGDTGIWYVPTAEVLSHGAWSGSVYRRGTNWQQGYTNVADFAGTFAVGIKDRAEIFGSFLIDTRIDRDTRPVFVNDPTVGGIVARYPKVNQYWTGDNVGDFYVGAKINLWSESRHNPVAIALRAIVKLPTGNADAGVSTGKPDFSVDAIVSKEAAKLVEISGYGGYEADGSPSGFTLPGGAFRWGAGFTFPSRNFLRLVGELNGQVPSSGTATITGTPLAGVDQSVPPLVSNTENLTRATLGLTLQVKKTWFFGAGVSWNMPAHARVGNFTDEPDAMGDYYDMQFRIGYHPGVKQYVAPVTPTCTDPKAINFNGPAPCQYPPPAEHRLTVKAECNPCSVQTGGSSIVTATVDDSISCAVTYRWSAPSGTLAQPGERSTRWTAPGVPGTVPVTITVTCPTDNKTASDTVNIQVTPPERPVVQPIRFEDVYFDFDRFTLRPEALRLLDDAIRVLQANPDKNIIIEGHTCSIGTAEYNLALGDRRASSVRQYLESRGVAAARMETRSYGEEQPKYDNAREETRRLNRRAALVVKVQ
jgi:outer membrane protein OmpA-like peptidoglycan-associated protein